MEAFCCKREMLAPRWFCQQGLELSFGVRDMSRRKGPFHLFRSSSVQVLLMKGVHTACLGLTPMCSQFRLLSSIRSQSVIFVFVGERGHFIKITKGSFVRFQYEMKQFTFPMNSVFVITHELYTGGNRVYFSCQC